MLLWQYVLDADDKADLSDPDAAKDWLRPQIEWWQTNLGRADALAWDAADEREWTRNVLALRSVAHRLKSRKPKRPYPTDTRSCLAADEVFRHDYLMKLRIQISDPPNLPLDRKTHRGLQLVPTMPTDERGAWVETRAIHPPAGVRRVPLFADLRGPIVHWNGMDFFWQCVFASVVSDDVDPVCGECGRSLGQTRKGRRSRRELCPRCNLKVWRSEQRKTKGVPRGKNKTGPR